MFKRDVILELQRWADKPNRKPLVLRGARQVGFLPKIIEENI